MSCKDALSQAHQEQKEREGTSGGGVRRNYIGHVAIDIDC